MNKFSEYLSVILAIKCFEGNYVIPCIVMRLINGGKYACYCEQKDTLSNI